MRNKFLLSILLLIVFTLGVSGQKSINSPFSRFNIGSIEPSGSFRSLSMGGVSTALRGNNTLHYSNPASFSAIDTNSFIFDFGVDYGRNTLSDGTTKYTSDDYNFDHMLIGFPIAKGVGIGLGIVPYSNGYYNISQTKTDDEIVGEYTSTHSGEGGFTNVFLGTGIKLTKNISAGINLTLLFGQINRLYQIRFTDRDAFSNNANEHLQLGGINFDYGLQYTANLKNDLFLNAGVSLTSNKYYNTKYEHLSYRSTTSSQDTISFVSNDSTSAYFPGTLRFGIAFGKKNKLVAGVDYVTTRWSKSKIPGSAGYTADSRTIMAGVEYTPDKFSNFSFLKRIDYRLGGHFGDSYLVLNGEQVKEAGASFGIGLPMRRSHNKTNIYIDYTRKTGSSISNLKYEGYLTAGISLNFYDFWFIQRKYD